MSGPARRRLVSVLERSLFALASVCLGGYALVQAESMLYSTVESHRLDRALREGPASAGPSRIPDAPRPRQAVQPRVPAPAAALPSGLVGRLEAPRLGLSAMVAEGIDARTLRRAVGHVPGTALPGQPGNVALAGHRDRAFRRLEGIRVGDHLRLVTPGGPYEYVVESALVVDPGRGDLLEPTPEPTLTLVTCYPFYMVGPAPQRFVVRARLLPPALTPPPTAH